MTEREMLAWIYKVSREALFERTHRAAAMAALKALSEINKKTAQYA